MSPRDALLLVFKLRRKDAGGYASEWPLVGRAAVAPNQADERPLTSIVLLKPAISVLTEISRWNRLNEWQLRGLAYGSANDRYSAQSQSAGLRAPNGGFLQEPPITSMTLKCLEPVVCERRQGAS